MDAQLQTGKASCVLIGITNKKTPILERLHNNKHTADNNKIIPNNAGTAKY